MEIYLKQTKDTTEVVQPNVLNKLYNCAYDKTNEKDISGIYYMGDLTTSKVFNSIYNYLTNKENTSRLNLDIHPSGFYIDFKDPALETLLINRLLNYGNGIGDGIGITEDDVNQPFANFFFDVFVNNTNIKYFPEFKYFKKVTNINGGFFQGCSNLEELDFSNIIMISVGRSLESTKIKNVELPICTTISGWGVFRLCKLESINAPVLTSLSGDNIFYGCTLLKDINMPVLTSVLPISCFENCTGLETIELNITEIDERAFYSCSNLTSVSFPNVTNIKSRAFMRCDSLTSVTLPNLQTITGDYAFYGLPALTSVSFPNLTSITGGEVFRNCSVLTTVNMPSLTSSNGGLFQGCKNLQSITLGNISYIPNNMFDTCSNLTSISINGQINSISPISIGNNAFYQDANINITIDLTNCTSIGDWPFANAKNIVFTGTINSAITTLSTGMFYQTKLSGNLDIPAHITTLKGSCLREISGLTSITFHSTTPPQFENNTYERQFDGIDSVIIYVPMNSVEAYKTAWSSWTYASTRIIGKNL